MVLDPYWHKELHFTMLPKPDSPRGQGSVENLATTRPERFCFHHKVTCSSSSVVMTSYTPAVHCRFFEMNLVHYANYGC